VEFNAFGCAVSTPNYVAQFYDDSLYESSETPVSVAPGSTTSGIDAQLAEGGTISGRVTDPSGDELAGICVSALDASGDFGSTDTGSDGSYSITGLASGSYDVDFAGCGGNTAAYGFQQYDGAVTVSTGSTDADIDGTLSVVPPSESGSISGQVLAASDDSPLENICVETYDNSGDYVGFAATGSDGSYTVDDLASGSYTVNFSNGCGNAGNYAPQWYKDASLASAATAVAVSDGQTTTGVDASLAAGGSIIGIVKSPSGAGITGVCVTEEPDNISVESEAGGYYEIDGLLAGTDTVQFSSSCNNPAAGPYGPQWYSGSASPGGAKSIDVALGVATTGVDATMSASSSFPSVTSVLPSSGAAGTAVTVTGTGFSTTAGATSVDFGPTSATAVSCSSSTSCSATVPAGTGTVHVTVTVAGLSSATSYPDEFTYSEVDPLAVELRGGLLMDHTVTL
jgi:hypothetical protein